MRGHINLVDRQDEMKEYFTNPKILRHKQMVNEDPIYYGLIRKDFEIPVVLFLSIALYQDWIDSLPDELKGIYRIKRIKLNQLNLVR